MRPWIRDGKPIAQIVSSCAYSSSSSSSLFFPGRSEGGSALVGIPKCVVLAERES